MTQVVYLPGDKPERKGSKMLWTADCGHGMVVYSLEPTPTVCPDCADAGRKVLADIVQSFSSEDLDDIPSSDELDEWLDECGVNDPEMRKDIWTLAQYGDDIRAALDSGEMQGRKMLAKYPQAERLTLDTVEV